MVWKKLLEWNQKLKKYEPTEIRFDLFGWTEFVYTMNYFLVSNENCLKNCLWEIEITSY